MSDLPKFSGRRLKERREELGFTLQDVATFIHSSKSYVHELEKGGTEPSGAKVLLLSRCLGMAMESFYGLSIDGNQYAAKVGAAALQAIMPHVDFDQIALMMGYRK